MSIDYDIPTMLPSFAMQDRDDASPAETFVPPRPSTRREVAHRNWIRERKLRGRYPENPSVSECFWDYVQRGEPHACWPWLGPTARGVPAFTVRARATMYPARRWCWGLAHGFMPPERVVLPICSNDLCVNPRHLVLGPPHQTGRRAELLPTTDELARAKDLYALGVLTLRELAQSLGMSERAAWKAFGATAYVTRDERRWMRSHEESGARDDALEEMAWHGVLTARIEAWEAFGELNAEDSDVSE